MTGAQAEENGWSEEINDMARTWVSTIKPEVQIVLSDEHERHAGARRCHL